MGAKLAEKEQHSYKGRVRTKRKRDPKEKKRGH